MESMRTLNEILAMADRARVEELKAKDQGLLSGYDTTAAREFAAGVEAGLLYAAGHISQPPFHIVEHVKPSGNDDDFDLADLPGFEAPTEAAL